jgi:adenylate cyclase
MNAIKNILLPILLIVVALPLLSQNSELAKIELLKEKLTTAEEDTNKVLLLQSLSFEYNSINPKEGLEYGKQSLELAKRIGYENGFATSHNRIGGNQFAMGDLEQALQSISKAMELNEQFGNKDKLSDNYANIGNIYYNLSNYTKALSYYQESLHLDEKLDNKSGIAANYGSVGNVYSNLSNFQNAEKYYTKALEMYELSDNMRGKATILGNIGSVYHQQGKYEKSLEYYYKSLELWQLFGNKMGIATNLGSIANSYNLSNEFAKATKYYEKATAISNEIGDKYGLSALYGNAGILYLRLSIDSVINMHKGQYPSLTSNPKKNITQSIKYSEKAVELAKEVGSLNMLSDWYESLDKAYTKLGNYKKAYYYQEKWTEIRDSVFSMDKAKEIATLEFDKQNQINEKELKLKDLQLLRKKNEQMYLFAGLGSAAIVLLIIFLQRRKSEQLLHNILPVSIAKRLKRSEKNIADRFDESSIVFIDLVGFSGISQNISPENAVEFLNNVFSKIDIITKEYSLEKIKTIGDCYMAVCGLPEKNENHAYNTVKFSQKVGEMLRELKGPNGEEISFRAGIDCGAVVAGIIGEKKFSYDLWGDSVNTASRMESTGVKNKIQVTKDIIDKIKETDINFEERGEILIKGKGKITTYFIKE